MISPVRVYCQDVVSAGNCPSGESWRFSDRGKGFIQKALISWLDFNSFSPPLKISKKITQMFKMKQHLSYWFEATGPAGSRGSVYVGDCVLDQIRPSIRTQRNAEKNLTVIKYMQHFWVLRPSSVDFYKFTSHVKWHFLKLQPDLFYYQKEMSQKKKRCLGNS